jgi:hypothetical protein
VRQRRPADARPRLPVATNITGESVGTAQEDCRFSVVGVRVIEMLFTEALG